MFNLLFSPLERETNSHQVTLTQFKLTCTYALSPILSTLYDQTRLLSVYIYIYIYIYIVVSVEMNWRYYFIASLVDNTR